MSRRGGMLVFVGNHRWFEEKQWPEEFLAIQDTQECPLRAPVDACINITDGNIQPMSIEVNNFHLPWL